MKKLLCLVLAFLLFAMPCSLSASAENYDDLVAPCYNNVDIISADIVKASLGFVQCTVGFDACYSGRTYELSCILQRCDENFSGWEDYKSKTESYTTTGPHVIEKSWYAPSGYYYRTQTKIVVKNANGVIIETVTLNSNYLYK